MTKKLLEFTALAAILMAAAGLGHAADLGLKPADPIAPVATPYDWSGPYIGLHAGWAWGNEHDDMSRLSSDVITTTTTTPATLEANRIVSADEFSLDGFMGGAHVGYNFQMQQFVLGGEVDFDYVGLGGTHRFAGVFNNTALSGDLKFKTDWQSSARLRAGYAIDNLLLYATGGIAFANGKLTVNGVGDSNTHIGWTIGGGAEYAFTPNWIGRAEVRYSDFSKETYRTPVGPIKADFNETTATLGLSYKF